MNLADQLAERIRSMIEQDNLPVGARLPSERELAQRLGGSRPTVSQALRSLSLMGLVEIRRGSGAYVARRPEAMVTASLNLMLDLDGRSLGDLMQLRLWLESIGVEEAATCNPALDESQRAEILTAVERLADAAGDAPAWIAADTVFHALVVRASGNPYLAAVYESVHTSILGFEFQQWVDQGAVPTWLQEADREAQFELHEPIARHVVNRDPEAAHLAVTAHHLVMLRHLGLEP